MKDDITKRLTWLYGERCPDYDPNCATCVGWEMIDQIAALRAEVAKARIAALEEAAGVCEANQRDFASDQYATGQPASSFAERFACGQCATAIRALIAEPEWIDPPRMTLGKQGD